MAFLAHPAVIALREFHRVLDADEEGLNLRIRNVDHRVRWSDVAEVCGGRARLDGIPGTWLLVVTLEIDTSEGTLLFMVAETDRVWSALCENASTRLAGLAPFREWGVALATASKPIILFSRSDPLSRSRRQS